MRTLAFEPLLQQAHHIVCILVRARELYQLSLHAIVPTCLPLRLEHAIAFELLLGINGADDIGFVKGDTTMTKAERSAGT